MDHELAYRQPAVARWSTSDVPAGERRTYLTHALSSELVPMQVECLGFRAPKFEMTVARLGQLAVIRQSGSARRSYRRPKDLTRGSQRVFHLILNLASPVELVHRGPLRLNAGDAVLTDSALPHDLELPADYELAQVQLSEAWLQRWVSDPSRLVGRLMNSRGTWNQVLRSLMAQISPEWIPGAPLPARVVGDQVGLLLSLIDQELHGLGKQTMPATLTLAAKVRDLVLLRCGETSLTEERLAASLGITTHALHAALAALDESFSGLLLRARVQVAHRLLASPSFLGLTVAEIAARAGFTDAVTLSRGLRRLSGCSPTQLRPRRAASE